MEKTDAANTALAFNNAGVFALKQGEAGVAWDLFKGSLELFRVVEATDDDVIVDLESITADPYIVKASRHLQHLQLESKDYQVTSNQGQTTNSNPASGSGSTGERVSSAFQTDEDFAFYTPFIHNHAFEISQEVLSKIAIPSAIVIFNLALVEHLVHPTSKQAISLYELAFSLLVGSPLHAVGIALLNNIGVLRFQNNEIDKANKCMEMLAAILAQSSSARMIASEKCRSIQQNIWWVLTAKGIASAAA